MKIPVTKVLMPESSTEPLRLLGFDYGGDIYHVIAFDFGKDGGALGIWREGDAFCARISLDSLVVFNKEAKALHIQGQA